MNFLDFFNELKSQKLSVSSKEQIFQRVQLKKRQQLHINKINRFARVWVLWLVILWVSAVTYFSRLSWQIWEYEINEGYIGVNVAKESGLVAYADQIGTIINTVWEVSITNNGVVKSWSDLAHADKVLLLDGAELIFQMQGGVQAKIIGPAKFELEKEGERYVINMTEGEFVEIKSVPEVVEEPVITDRIFVEDEPNPQPKAPAAKSPIQVVVKTPEFEVESDTIDGDIDLVIQEKDGKQIVENTWADAVITKVIKDEVIVTELKSQQKADINGEVLIATITPDLEINEAQADQLKETIKNNELTISYTIEPDPTLDAKPVNEIQEDPKEEAAPAPVEKPAPVVAKLPEKVAKIIAEPIVVEPAPIPEPETQEEPLIQGKRVIGGADLASLQNATNSSVLLRDIRNIVTNHSHGNASGLQTSLSNVAAGLSPVTQGVLWWMLLNTSSPATLQNSIQSMIDNLEAKRYVPPVYTNRLKSMIAWLRLMQTIPSGSVEATCNFDCIVNDVLKVQPAQKSRLMLP